MTTQIHPHTEIINKKQKNRSKLAKFLALKWLAKRFPEAFDNSLNIRPLKKGIIQDVLEFAEEAHKEGISKSKLKQAVGIYTKRIDYLTALKSQEYRIDLFGKMHEQVTEDEANAAALKIKKIIEKNIKNAKKTTIEEPVVNSNFIKSFTFDSSKLINPPKTEVKSPKVVVKSKINKKIDPEAVSRLKAKLGLIRETENA